MKKLLATLVILLVAAGMFAQEIVPFGAVGLTFGGQVAFSQDPGDADKTKSIPTWLFEMSHGNLGVGVRFISDQVFAQVSIDNTGSPLDWMAFATYTFENSLGLTMGYRGLPSGYFSDVSFHDDGAYFTGATVIDRAPQIGIDFMGFQAGVAGDITGYASFTPIFFLAYNYGNAGGPMGPPDPVTFGVTFTGWAFGKDNDDWEGTTKMVGPPGMQSAIPVANENSSDFPMLFTVHGRYAAEAFSVYGNVGIWIGSSTFSGVPAQIYNPTENEGPPFIKDKDSMILEGYLGFTYNISETVRAALTVAYAQELASVDDGGGANVLKAALGVPINIGGGFQVIPGLTFEKHLKNNIADPDKPGKRKLDDSKTGAMLYGVTMVYHF